MSKVKNLFRNIWLNLKGFAVKCMLLVWVCIGSIYLYIKIMYWIYVLQLTFGELTTNATNLVNNWYKPFRRSISDEEMEEILGKHFIK